MVDVRRRRCAVGAAVARQQERFFEREITLFAGILSDLHAKHADVEVARLGVIGHLAGM
jgi:hypothetical protein